MTHYLTPEDILRIHSNIVDQTGGAHGIRDIGRIQSMVERPKQQKANRDLYPTLFEKAAVYFEVSEYHHPFTDGNKRTAITLAGTFLSLNGYEMTVSNREMVDFILEAVIGKYVIPTLAEWFKKNSRKVRRRK